MAEDNVGRVAPHCHECHQVSMQQLPYAGRILAASRCVAAASWRSYAASSRD